MAAWVCEGLHVRGCGSAFLRLSASLRLGLGPVPPILPEQRRSLHSRLRRRLLLPLRRPRCASSGVGICHCVCECACARCLRCASASAPVTHLRCRLRMLLRLPACLRLLHAHAHALAPARARAPASAAEHAHERPPARAPVQWLHGHVRATAPTAKAIWKSWNCTKPSETPKQQQCSFEDQAKPKVRQPQRQQQ